MRHTFNLIENLLKRFVSTIKLHIIKIILIAILAYGTILRISYLDSHAMAYDVQKDYLVASHIVRYKESLFIGHSNSVFGSVVFPVYYYFLALLLILERSINFLHIINILLQESTLIIIYFLAKQIFSRMTALITIILLGFSNVHLSQSAFIFQPFTINPFINASYLLLFMAYFRKSYIILLFSIITFIISGTIHGSAHLMMPIFTILAIGVLRNQHAKLRYHLLSLIIAVLIFFFSYLPIFINRGEPNPINSSSVLSKVVTSPYQIYENFTNNFVYLSGTFFNFFDSMGNDIARKDGFSSISNLGPDVSIGYTWKIASFLPSTASVLGVFSERVAEDNQKNIMSFILFFIVYITIWVYFFHPGIPRFKKIFVGILIYSILVLLLGLSVLKFPNLTFWYFTSVLGLFVIVVAECINTVFSRHPLLITFKVIIIFLLTVTFAFNLSRHNILHKRLPDMRILVDPAISSVASEVQRIHKEEITQNLNFFQVQEYLIPKFGSVNFFTNPYIYSNLEEKFSTKFVKVINKYPSFAPINDNIYIFLFCKLNELQSCIDFFLKQYPSHRLIREIHKDSTFVVNLTKRVH